MTYAVCDAHVAFRAEIVAGDEKQSKLFCLVCKSVRIVFKRFYKQIKRTVGTYAIVADFRKRVEKQVAVLTISV